MENEGSNDGVAHSAKEDSSFSRANRKKSGKKSSQLVSVVCREDGAWEFKEPRCAKARREDLEEVRHMIDAGEIEIAQDELRWLLNGCRDFMAAHRLLGDLAVETGDQRLARAHYGYAYQIGVQAIDRVGSVTSLPYCSAANRPFWESAKGLVQVLLKLNKTGMARDVIQRLLALEPGDPLELKRLSLSDSGGSQKKKGRNWRKRKRGSG
jgi:hypothetical protein